MNRLKRQRAFLIVLCSAAALFLSDIWAYREFVRAESYFALGARLMIEQGNWLTPHAPDELPLNKPPLTQWLIGIAYKLFGVSYGSARLPSVIAALAILALVYFFGRRLAGERAGIVASATLATSYLFMNFARMAMSDMLLTLFVTASLLSFIVVLTSAERESRLFADFGYGALALAILTKGPVALALVVLPLALDLVVSRSRKDFRKLCTIRGLVLILAITAPYFVLVYIRAGAEPLRFFFLGENLKRFTGQIYGPAGRPFWYQFVAVFGDFAPWSLLLPVAAWLDWKARRQASNRAKRIIYLWFACGMLLFSASSFKLDYYLLPLMPAASLIIAPLIADAVATGLARQRLVKSFFALAAILLLVVGFFSWRAADALSVYSWLRFLPLIVAAVGVVGIAYCIVRRSSFATAIALCAVIATTMLSIELTLLPAFAHFLPMKRFVSAVPASRVWHTSPGASDWASDLEFNLPAGQSVGRLIGKDETSPLKIIENNPNAVVLIRAREYANLGDIDRGVKILSQAETYGHGGFNLRMLRHAQRERLFVIGRNQE